MPSQPPQNVRAISVTSDEAVITWAEPPRMTLHGVLKGYRVVFWAVFPDGGVLSSSVRVKLRSLSDSGFKSDLLSTLLSNRVGRNAEHHNHQGASGAQRPGKVH